MRSADAVTSAFPGSSISGVTFDIDIAQTSIGYCLIIRDLKQKHFPHECRIVGKEKKNNHFDEKLKA